MVLEILHGGLSNTAQFYFFAIAAWGFWRFFRKQGVDSSYRGALVIAEILLLSQGLIGAVLFFTGHNPARGVHFLYGAFVAVIIPGVFAYTKGGEGRSEMLIYGASTLIAAVLIMRAIITA
jgi:heme A synthase